MNDNDPTDTDGPHHDPRAEDMTVAEMREEALERLDACDGAILISANLVDDDEDGENEATSLTAMKFVDEDYSDEERHHVHMALTEGAIDVVSDGANATAIPVSGDEMGGALLKALAGAMGGPAPDRDDDEDTDEDGDEYGSMFA